MSHLGFEQPRSSRKRTSFAVADLFELPVFCTHSPVLLASVAIQSARKARWRSGAKAVAGVSGMALRSALALVRLFGLRETGHTDIYELAWLIGSVAVDGLEFLTRQMNVREKE